MTWLPVIDVSIYLADPNSEQAKQECKKAAEALHFYSALAIKDGRVSFEHNNKFLNTMEDYFAQSEQDKFQDVKPELSFQVGATPENQEIPSCGSKSDCLEFISNLTQESKPLPFDQPDPKWRFFHRIGRIFMILR